MGFFRLGGMYFILIFKTNEVRCYEYDCDITSIPFQNSYSISRGSFLIAITWDESHVIEFR